KKLLFLSLFILVVSISVHAQDTLPKGSEYVLIKMYDPFLNDKGIIFIILPSGESKVIDCPIKPKGITSKEYEINLIAKNEAKLLEILEAYKKDGYELKTTFQNGNATTYLLIKKTI